MQKIGQGTVVYGEDVEALQFDWGTLKIHNEPAVTGSARFSSGVVVVKPGMGHSRHKGLGPIARLSINSICRLGR